MNRARSSRKRRRTKKPGKASQAAPKGKPGGTARRWLSAQPGRLLTIIGVALSTAVGVVALWLSLKQFETIESSVASDRLIDFSNFDGYPPSSLAGVKGLAVGGTIANSSPSPFILTQIDAELYGKSYKVHFATKGNCHGGPLELDAAKLVPIEIFIEDLPGDQMIKAGTEGETLRLVAKDARGAEMEIQTTLPDESTKRAYDMQLVELEGECRGKFIG